MKNKLGKIAFAIIALSVFGSVIALAAAPPIYFTDNMAATGTSLLITPMEQALLDYITGATTSIDAAFYDFNRNSIRDALIAAHGRGVTVRVVTDDEARLHIDSYIPYYAAIENAGIPVKDDQRENSIMHNKYFVIDGQTVWSGSTNMTDNGFTKNHNNSIVFASPDVVAIYRSDFDQMWAGNFSVNKTASVTTTTTFDGKPLELYFSPKDDALDEIIKAVNAAQTSIDLAIFFFTSDDLANVLTGSLVKARRRGVQVRAIWDLLGASSAFSDDETLCAAGIPVKIEDTIGKMHNKLMVIDADGASPKTITGSMNWTSSGDTKNDENTIIYHDSVTAQAYSANFQSMWDALDPSTQCETGAPKMRIFLPLILSGSSGSIILPTPAIVQIATIVYNPDGSDADGEYVEISNQGGLAQAMVGWTLSDEADNVYTFPTFSLPPSGSVKVWVTSGSNAASDLYWGKGSAVWNNGGDTAMLKDADQVLVDQCGYGGGEQQVDCN